MFDRFSSLKLFGLSKLNVTDFADFVEFCCEFSLRSIRDFVEFCSTEHMPHPERTIWEYEEQTGWYEERLSHIWKNLRRAINENGLHEEMMRGATFNNFTHFVKNYMHLY